jgi:ABC-2 type transport system ATP-binding protein
VVADKNYMIRVEGLTKDYGARRAIDNLTFNAKRGEILGFLGPNGAGKTTTMRILSGYMPPSAGKVEVAGFDILEQSLDVRRRVGYMPETVPLYPEMTVFDSLKFMADLRHLADPEDRVEDALESVHMGDRSESYVANLSKGMRQRVGLAQALLHSPEVLILDEPTIGLDPAQIIEVRNLIREIGEQRTVLLSTHILSEAQQLCNRVLIINHGRIVAEDSPERLQADGIGDLIGKVPGVIRVQTIHVGSFEFEMAPGRDVRPAVARAVVDAHYDLMEIRPVGMSLEEIFLQLTRDEPTPPAPIDHDEEELSEAEEQD